MEKILLLTCSLTIMLVLHSCKGTDDDTPPITPSPCIYDCDTSKLEVIWQSPLNPADTGAYGSFAPIVYKDDVLFSRYSLNALHSEYLHLRDGSSGELKWEWYNHFTTGESATVLSSLVVDNKFVYNTWHQMYGIDLNTGQDSWRYNLTDACGDNMVTRVGDYAYWVNSPCGTPTSSNSLVRSSIDDGMHWDTITTIYPRDGYTPYLAPPSYWVSPSGDTILLLLCRTLNFDLGFPESNRVDLYVYNLTQDSLIYTLEHLDAGDSGYANNRPPTVWNDRMIVQGGYKLYCFDILTGEKLWTKTLETHIVFTGLLIVDDKVILKTDAESIYAINPINGNTIWRAEDCGSNCADMKEYDGIIYYGCLGDGLLFAIDAETGNRIWKEKSPNHKKYSDAYFIAGVAINPEKGCLYTHDNYFAMCIKLAKR